jgi:membrane associated rhomboid family serine protease
MTSETPEQTLDNAEQTYCYGHPDVPTRLRCSRCERPICGRCAIPASVGQHCPECVAEARRSQRKVRSVGAASSPATMVIIAICVFFWFVETFNPSIVRSLGSFQPAIAAGEWWRLLTPMLLHAPRSLWHIGLNMYVLWLYGPEVERAFGTPRFVGLFVVAGFLGGAASYAFGPCPALGVGASGAIFGVVGALLIYLYNRRRSAFVRGYLKSITILVMINLAFGFIVPGIDNLAHLGGLAGGIMVGAGFDAYKGRRGALVDVAALAFVIALGIALVAWKTANFTCVGL